MMGSGEFLQIHHTCVLLSPGVADKHIEREESVSEHVCSSDLAEFVSHRMTE